MEQNDYFNKSLGTLELGAVLNMLSEQAGSTEAKQSLLQLRPSTDAAEVSVRLSQTSAAKKMVALKGSPSFGGVKNVCGSIRRADMGGTLSTVELMDIASVLRSASAVSSYGQGEREEPSAIDYLFHAVRGNKFLENKISTSILGADEIADCASAELRDIRRHMRIAGDNVRQALNKIVNSPSYAKALQEPIITMKNDRYVIPVKAEHKASVPGLVHDISSSGATLFIEPMAAVKANNEIRELLAREKKEIERILAELSADAAAHGDDIISDFNVLTKLDEIFAAAKLSYKLNACEPEISQDGVLELKKARHPLLPQDKAVPIDMLLGDSFDTLVITGPNTGGKTVTLKTIGLLSAMAQCGLHIPAGDGSRLPVFTAILADIGDEQSIEQSLSTFSAHMKNIVNILGGCGEGTLLLFDELGAGTDPTEGAALAISIIEYARKLGSKIAATTHYAELKLYATTTEGVQNASCEFNVETLKPTYRLIIGVPGKSNAFAISKRLGIQELIIDDAKKRIDAGSASLEDVLEKLEDTRQKMERERAEAARLLYQAQENEKKSQIDRQASMREREQAAKIARREADKIIEDARRAAEQAYGELAKMRRELEERDSALNMNERRAELNRMLNEAQSAVGERQEEAPPASDRPAKVGDRVKVLSIGAVGDVISEKNGVLQIQAGILKISASQDEVRITQGSAEQDKKQRAEKREVILRNYQMSPEIDIRGMTTDEAIPVVQKFIDDARLSKLTHLTIIQGKGTGALRAAVQKYLRGDKAVKSFRPGHYGEGEAGVTIVELK